MARRLLDGYALLLVLYLALRALTGDRLWPVALFAWVAAPAAILALVLVPAALWWHRWLVVGVLLCCGAWLLALLGAGSVLRQPDRVPGCPGSD